MKEYKMPPVKFEHPMSVAEARAYQFPEVLAPAEWAEQNFYLDGGYAEAGLISFHGREWQIEPVNAITKYSEVYLIAPTRSGKSLIWHIVWAWHNATVGANCLIIFSDMETVEGVFEERLKPCVKGTLKELWSGREDDIRRDKIMLGGYVTRTGSCRVEADMSTFGASVTIGDEVAKWKSHVDAINMTRGRREDYKGLPGYHDKSIWCSSPKEEGDPLHREINKGGVLQLHYVMQCPSCYRWHELMDQYIEEVPNADGEKDHNPLRIKNDNAAIYRCPHCQQQITDLDRYSMIPNGRWITKQEELDAEGNLLHPDPLRERAKEVAYTWNRLVLPPEKYSFADCLAAFHAARTAPDPRAMAVYQNEHMARFLNPVTNKISHTYLATKTEQEYSTTSPIPHGVLAAVAGIDTQDAGFYFVVVGYGMHMESWVLRYGWIPCPMNEAPFKDNPEAVRLRFMEYWLANPLHDAQGELVPVMGAFIDEGGHRKKDVVYLSRKHPEIQPYKGSSNDKAPLLERSEKQKLWLGNTKQLSRLIERDMESDAWHLPSDVDDEFLKQAANQFTKKEVDRHGNTKTIFVCQDPDHYRDCLNYARAAAEWHGLPGRLRDENGAAHVKNIVSNRRAELAVRSGVDKPAGAPRPASPFSDRPRLWGRRRIG